MIHSARLAYAQTLIGWIRSKRGFLHQIDDGKMYVSLPDGVGGPPAENLRDSKKELTLELLGETFLRVLLAGGQWKDRRTLSAAEVKAMLGEPQFVSQYHLAPMKLKPTKLSHFKGSLAALLASGGGKKPLSLNSPCFRCGEPYGAHERLETGLKCPPKGEDDAKADPEGV